MCSTFSGWINWNPEKLSNTIYSVSKPGLKSCSDALNSTFLLLDSNFLHLLKRSDTHGKTRDVRNRSSAGWGRCYTEHWVSWTAFDPNLQRSHCSLNLLFCDYSWRWPHRFICIFSICDSYPQNTCLMFFPSFSFWVFVFFFFLQVF